MSETRPFRFGVLAESPRDHEELVGLAWAAEAAGYATLLMRDHFVPPPFGHQLALLTALATAAAATERLRIGTLVLDNDYRHPVILAKEAATLDLLSGGRLELGLGAAWLKAEYAQAGLPFDSHGTRIDRLHEAIHVLRGLFGDGPCTFAGDHYQVAGLDSFPKPVQRPHPPLLIGAGGPRMLALAGREADIVGILNASVADGVLSLDPAQLAPERVSEKVERVRAAAKDRANPPELSMVIDVVVTPDREKAARHYATARGWDAVPAADVLAMPSVLIGTIDEIVADVRARHARFGITYVVVGDGALAALAPVVERLHGT